MNSGQLNGAKVHTRLGSRKSKPLSELPRSDIPSTSKRMPFKLGNQTIVPINDGSVEIVYQNDERKRVSWKGGLPLLSIEVVHLPSPNTRLNRGHRQSDASPKVEGIQTSYIATPLKYSAKCWDRHVTPTCTPMPK